MNERTKESWEIQGKCIACGTFRIGQVYGEATRKRIVADHNACLGIEDPETTVPELVAACRICEQTITRLIDLDEPLSAKRDGWVPKQWNDVRGARQQVHTVLAKTEQNRE